LAGLQLITDGVAVQWGSWALGRGGEPVEVRAYHAHVCCAVLCCAALNVKPIFGDKLGWCCPIELALQEGSFSQKVLYLRSFPPLKT
jgi:hypothetical protein